MGGGRAGATSNKDTRSLCQPRAALQALTDRELSGIVKTVKRLNQSGTEAQVQAAYEKLSAAPNVSETTL